MKYKKFVPHVPYAVPANETIGNNVVQEKNSASVPYVPYVPYENISFIQEQTIQEEIENAIALSVPDTSLYVKNREHREHSQISGVNPVPGDREHGEQHREQHREQAAIVAIAAPSPTADNAFTPLLAVMASGLTWPDAERLHAELKATVPGQRLYGIGADPAQPGAWRIVKRNY